MGQVWLELENMIDCAVVFLRPVTTFWMDLCGFMIANRFLELTCYGTINKWEDFVHVTLLLIKVIKECEVRALVQYFHFLQVT